MAKRKRRSVNRKGRTPEGDQFARLSYRFLRDDAWRTLSGPAVKVFLELRSRYNGGNNGRLHLSLDEAARSLGIGKATAQRAFDDLERRGFIRMARRGNWYGRRATEWIVTDCPLDGEQATNDWRHWKSQKTGSRSVSEPMGCSDGSASEPKDTRRVRLRTDGGDFSPRDGSASEPLVLPEGSTFTRNVASEWQPIGRLIVQTGLHGPGTNPSQRRELYRGAA
jgi:GNAT superfamily N-acetyltransferase